MCERNSENMNTKARIAHKSGSGKKKGENSMENKYADVFEKALSEHNFEFLRKEKGDEVVFLLPMHADNAPGLNVRMIIDSNGDSKFRCYIAEDVPEKKWSTIMKVCNRLNSNYRYISLSIDEDGDVCSAYDFAIFGNDEVIAEHAITMLGLCSHITDKCIPDIMKSLWIEDSGENGQPVVRLSPFQVEGGEV